MWGYLLLAAAMVLLMPSGAQAQATFSQQLNPTGDPLGGGPGYSRLVTASQANYVVSDKAGLLSALSSARAGQIVFVVGTAVIDLTGQSNIGIPAGVTLASDRGARQADGSVSWGALITSSDAHQDGMTPLFVTGGDDVRITGLRLKGPSSFRGMTNAGDLPTSFGFALAIKQANGSDLEVDNCEIYAWQKWAIWLYHLDGARIHHNWIHHTRLTGFGYGIWTGSPRYMSATSPTNPSTVIVEGNIFESNRHSTAARAGTNEYTSRIFRHNAYVGYHESAMNDVHDDINGLGAYTSDFYRNAIIGTRNSLTGAIPDLYSRAAPYPGGRLSFRENWVEHPNSCFGAFISILSCNADPASSTYNPAWKTRFSAPVGDIMVAGNRYAKQGQMLPAVRIAPSATTIKAGQQVTLDLAASTDPEGYGFSFFEVIWADGKNVVDETHRLLTTLARVSHMFVQPGTYPVRVRGFNRMGVPSEPVVQEITVLPGDSLPALSVWLGTDNWTPRNAGLMEAQLYLNGQKVWARDLARIGGYEHVVLNIASFVTGATLDVSFRIQTLQNINAKTGIYTGVLYIDDMDLFNVETDYYATVCDPGFDLSVKQCVAWGGDKFDPHDSRHGSGSVMYLASKGFASGAVATLQKTFNILKPDALADDGAVLVSWTDVRPVDSYQVRYRAAGASPSYPSPVNIGRVRNVWLNGLTNGQPYKVQVRPVVAGVPGAWSRELTVTPQPKAGLARKLVAAWTFDSAASPYLDAVGGMSLSPTQGSVPSMTSRLGRQSILDGTKWLQTSPLPSRLEIGVYDYTVEMWITPDDVATTRGLFSDGGGMSTGDQGFMIALGRGLWVFFSDDATRIDRAGGVLVAGRPNHIVVTFDRDGVMTGYVNGVAVLTRDISFSRSKPIRPTGPLELAPRFSGRYDGTVDEMRIWSDRVLLPAEVTYLFNSGIGRVLGEVNAAVPMATNQRIALAPGWNLVSSAALPREARMEEVFGAMKSEITLVKNQEGEVFDPAANVNSIGSWGADEVYLVHARSAVVLDLGAPAAAPAGRSIELIEGWNWIPYPGHEPRPVAEVLGAMAPHISIVKDASGNMYFPAYGIDTIGLMLPGQGYEVFVTEPGLLTYP